MLLKGGEPLLAKLIQFIISLFSKSKPSTIESKKEEMPKYKYSKKSLRKILTCHEDIQALCFELIKYRDITILEGHRTKERQDQLKEEGKSQLNWPHSRHNSFPSEAVDMVPYPIPDWNDIPKFEEFKEFVKGIADELGIKIQAGGDWPSFRDYPHYELKENK